MKHLRKSILTLLALTLFGGAGAWAQGPTQVTEITTDLIASWQNDNSDVTLADLQALGFKAVDASVAQAWTGYPQGEYSVLIYGFDGGYFTYILFDDNGHANLPSHTSYTKRGLYGNVAPNGGGTKHFYTSGPQAIELTKEGANQWTLGQTPDYDLELQVEYYEAHALKNIPAGWQVLINGHDSTSRIVEGSLNITETDTVTLVPDGNRRRVKSVTLEEPLQSINVSGHKIYYLPGESWEQAIMNHPENTGWYISGSRVYFDDAGILAYDDYPFNDVGKGDEIDPNRSCSLGM